MAHNTESKQASPQTLFGPNKITLVKAPTGWQAIFTGPHAQEIVALFGTNSIPTPFTADALPEMVRREIQAKNLNVIVEVL